MMDDEIIYKALRDEILANKARVANLQYLSVFLGMADLALVQKMLEGPNTVAAAFLVAFGSLMTALLLRSVYTFGIGSLHIGAYLLALEERHKHTRWWEHLMLAERGLDQPTRPGKTWPNYILDPQVWLQLVYGVSIGYIYCAYKVSPLWLFMVLAAFVLIAWVLTGLVIVAIKKDPKDYIDDIDPIKKWMDGEDLRYKRSPWYRRYIQ